MRLEDGHTAKAAGRTGWHVPTPVSGKTEVPSSGPEEDVANRAARALPQMRIPVRITIPLAQLSLRVSGPGTEEDRAVLGIFSFYVLLFQTR